MLSHPSYTPTKSLTNHATWYWTLLQPQHTVCYRREGAQIWLGLQFWPADRWLMSFMSAKVHMIFLLWCYHILLIPLESLWQPCYMIMDLASTSTHCLLWEIGCSDLAAFAGPALLANSDSRVTYERHGSQDRCNIAPGVLSHPSCTLYKVFDNHGERYGTMLQPQHREGAQIWWLAGHIILVKSQRAGGLHGSQGRSDIARGVLIDPSYTHIKSLTTIGHDMGPCSASASIHCTSIMLPVVPCWLLANEHCMHHFGG